MRDLIQKAKWGHADTDAHVLTLFSLVVSLGAKKILELGVRDGNSTDALLKGVEYTGGVVTSVDIEGTSYVPTNKSRWHFHRGDALVFLNTLPEGEMFDLVFVDDWHSYRHVSDELRLLDQHVTPASLILLHDTMYGTTPNYHSDLTLKTGQWANGGPYRAVAELDPQFWEFSTIPVGHGLTILRKKYSTKYFAKE